MRLFVIMSNDFPAGVMDDEAKALALVKERNDADERACKVDSNIWPRVYWKVFAVTLNEIKK